MNNKGQTEQSEMFTSSDPARSTVLSNLVLGAQSLFQPHALLFSVRQVFGPTISKVTKHLWKQRARCPLLRGNRTLALISLTTLLHYSEARDVLTCVHLRGVRTPLGQFGVFHHQNLPSVRSLHEQTKIAFPFQNCEPVEIKFHDSQKRRNFFSG